MARSRTRFEVKRPTLRRDTGQGLGRGQRSFPRPLCLFGVEFAGVQMSAGGAPADSLDA